MVHCFAFVVDVRWPTEQNQSLHEMLCSPFTKIELCCEAK
jgi:hypothetical protein